MRDHRYILGWLLLCLCLLATANTTPPITQTLHVQIIGLKNGALKNAFLHLADKQDPIKNNFTTANILLFYQQMPKDIQTAIQPYGYFQSHVSRDLQHRDNQWFAYFKVSPGPRMRFTQVRIQLAGDALIDPIFARLLAKFPIHAGDFFDIEKYNEAKQALLDVASARGYFDAKMVKSTIYVDLHSYQARVVIEFNSGKRYRLSLTHFSPTPFHQRFLYRFLTYQPGDYYSLRKLQQTREGLAGSNYFSAVIVTPDVKDAKNKAVPVNINLQPQARKQYTLGLGYGTDTGIRGLAGVDLRWVNQYGHRFNAYARPAQTNSELVANYYIPGNHPATDQYIFSAGYLNQNQPTGESNSGRFAAGYQTNVFGWQQTLSLIYLIERYRLTGNPTLNSTLVYPTITWQKVRFDSPLYPKYGYSLVGGVTGASAAVLSKTSYIQGRLNGRYLFTIRDNTRVILADTFGYTDINQIANLPLSLQLFAGGAQNFRGYAYNSIGPGRELFVGSIEVQQRIIGNFYLAAFFDFGNVSNNIFHEPLKQGIGPGLAWLSPIGMLELTVANAISQPNRPWVIQFSMGPAI